MTALSDYFSVLIDKIFLEVLEKSSKIESGGKLRAVKERAVYLEKITELKSDLDFNTFISIGEQIHAQMNDLIFKRVGMRIRKNFLRLSENFLKQVDVIFDQTVNYPVTFCYGPPMVQAKKVKDEIFNVEVDFWAQNDECSISLDKMKKFSLKKNV